MGGKISHFYIFTYKKTDYLRNSLETDLLFLNLSVWAEVNSVFTDLINDLLWIEEKF